MGLWLGVWGKGRCDWASGWSCGGGEGVNGPLAGCGGEGKARMGLWLGVGGEGKARMGLWLGVGGRGRHEWASGWVWGGGEGANGPLVGCDCPFC